MNAASQRVVRNYLLIAGLYTLSASVIWGVNTLFLLDAGLDLLGVFTANAAFTVGMVAFEIPTGVVADTVGRRASFLASAAVLFLGTLGYLIVAELDGGLGWFIVASLVLGLGFTFYSGAVEAWLVDALDDAGYEGDLDRIFARGAIVSGVAMVGGTLGGGVLGDVDLAVPFVARAVLLVAVFAVATIVMHDRGFVPRRVGLRELPSEMATVARAGIDHGWSVRPARWLFTLSFVQTGFLIWGFYAWQPFVLELLEEDLIWVVGATSAGLALATIVGNLLVGTLARPCGKRTTLLAGGAAALSAAAIGMGFATEFWQAAALLMLLGAALGVMGPVQQAFLHGLVPSEQRATVVSFGSMIGSVGGIGGQTALGYISQERSISDGYIVGGVASTLSLPILWMLRRQQSEADILGSPDEAGQRAACAAQGLPEATGVDAVPRTAREAA